MHWWSVAVPSEYLKGGFFAAYYLDFSSVSDSTSILTPSRGKSPKSPSSRPNKRRGRGGMWVFKLILGVLIFGLFLAAIGSLVAYLYAKPRYELAQEFNLDGVHDLETASIIFDRNGDELGRIYVQNRQPISINEVPKMVIDCLIAAEDGRFFEHEGVDYVGIIRAALLNFQAGRRTQGASTITQQLARNTFELPDDDYSRKVVEIFLSQRMEKEFSKEEILEHYLNRIYFGSGYYGIAAASEGYFGKEPRDLTVPEAATICGLIKSPNRLSPHNNPELSKKSRDNVLRRMVDEGSITQKEREEFEKVAIRTVPKGTATGKSKYAYERVRQRVIELVGYEQAQEGGFRIYTTIDNAIQQTAENSLKKQLSVIEGRKGYQHQNYAVYKSIRDHFREANKDVENAQPPAPSYLQGAVLMIDNRTGGIIAMVGGRNFSDSMFDRTWQGRRPVGTAFKPFVYATSFENGAFPGTLVDDSPIDGRRVQIGGLEGILGEWGVETLRNPYEGEITARHALAKGKNAATVRLGENTGLSKIVALAEKAGMRFSGDLKNYNATLLGRNEASPTELALAYTIFPNAGRKPRGTHIISSIRDSGGRQRFSVSPKLGDEEVIDPFTAHQITSTLQDVILTGTGRKAIDEYGLEDFPVAGKTGTEYGFTDNWFVGFTSEVTCVVWAGFDQTQEIYPGAFSNDTVLPIWTDVMNSAAQFFKPREFEPPNGAKAVEICSVSGQLATDACYEQMSSDDGKQKQVRSTYLEYLRPGTEIAHSCTYHSGGVRPRTGRILRPDGSITLNSGQPIRAIQVTAARSVMPIGPTILGDDPYESILPTIRATIIPVATPSDDEEETEDKDEKESKETPIIRAKPVEIEESSEAGTGDPVATKRPVAQPVSGGLPVATPVEPIDKPATNRVRLVAPKPIEID